MRALRLATAILACSFAYPAIPAAAQSLETNSPAPAFEVSDGDDRIMTLDMTRGSVTLVFHEARSAIETNRGLKKEIGRYRGSLDDDTRRKLLVLAVVDCSSAWPFTGIWKRKLRENSKKEGITIYGDWNGKMLSDYKMKKDGSNIIIIDKSGRIRLFLSGEVKQDETSLILEMLDSLMREQSGVE